MRRVITIMVVAGASLSAPVWAQQNTRDVLSNPHLKLGPLGLTAAVGIRDLGIDSNVFNTAEDRQEDYSGTLAGRLEGGLRFGRAMFRTKNHVDFNYFRTFTSENSVNRSHQVIVDLPANRLLAHGSAEFLSTRQRPGYEIDARARRVETVLRAGAAANVSGRTTLAADVRHATIAFEGDPVFFGTSLEQQLNRTEESAKLNVRYAVTPLTAVGVQAEVDRARFQYLPTRNARGVRIGPRIDFDAGAFLTGAAFVGYRWYHPDDQRLPEFRGLTTTADLVTRRFRRMSLGFQANRDIGFSFEATHPFYVQEGFSMSLSYALTSALELRLHGGQQWLDYRALASTTAAARRDVVLLYGAGLAHRVGAGLQLGINAEYAERNTDRASSRYRALKIMSAIGYGF